MIWNVTANFCSVRGLGYKREEGGLTKRSCMNNVNIGNNTLVEIDKNITEQISLGSPLVIQRSIPHCAFVH